VKRSAWIEINGHRWRVKRCRVPPSIDGDCDYETRTIRVSSKLHGEDFLNTLIHEYLHARFPDLSEECVSENGDTLAALITFADFRHVDDDPED